MHFLMRKISLIFIVLLTGLTFVLGGCNPQSSDNDSNRIHLMATTSIVGDVVQQIGKESVDVEVLLPLGTDPHSFTPTPSDISRMVDAELVFISGAGLEEFLSPMIASAGVDVRLVDLSADIPLRSMESDSPGEEHGEDPHTWMDPNNVIIWAQIVAEKLAQLNPRNQVVYQDNAKQYQTELVELDLWVEAQVKQIPIERRRLVTDHLVFGYFADRYGFQQVGAIIPGFSTLAEPSARELARLEDAIMAFNIPALFVSWSGNQNLADRIAEDTGVRLIPLYTHSLSPAGEAAEHYQDFIRYNVNAIVEGLK